MLQKENGRLRDEVSQLKTLLLAHTNCPVTQLQLHAGQLFINGGETKYIWCAEFLLITVAMTTRCIIIMMRCRPGNGSAIVAVSEVAQHRQQAQHG